MSVVLQKDIDKKLCIYCEHCVVIEPIPMCGLIRSKVDDSPAFSAEYYRYNNCGKYGRYWSIHPDIKIAQTEDEKRKLIEEEEIQKLMPYAIDVATGKINRNFIITTGYIEKAIKRAESEILNQL